MKTTLTPIQLKVAKLIAKFGIDMAGLLSDYRTEVTEEIYASLRERIGKAPAARKETRGPRRCGKCGSLKHDARTHNDAKAAKGKKATITVLKAA